MTRHDAAAAALAMTCWVALLPAYFGQFLPLACWLTGWAFLLFLAPTKDHA